MEALWKASVKKLVFKEECTRPGLPCTLHPHLAPSRVPGKKAPRASACEAEEKVHRRFQEEFRSELGLRLLESIQISLCKHVAQFQVFFP